MLPIQIANQGRMLLWARLGIQMHGASQHRLVVSSARTPQERLGRDVPHTGDFREELG